MNILPKKSWHVLSRDNIQRVRRDEAAAKAKEEEQQRRADLAEKEARLAYMRRQARDREGIEASSAGHGSTDTTLDGDRHNNFFADIQHGIGVQSLKNKDHESEEKKEREKFEKKVGILNYLVDKDKSDDPWYVKDKKKEEASARAKKRAELLDPLTKMNEFLEKKRKIDEKTHEGATAKHQGTSVSKTSKSSQDDRHHHKKHKHKSKSSSTDMERLRRERRRREEAERVKAEDLLRKYHGLPNETESSFAAAPPERKYNSQFNPHLARH